MTIKDKIQEKKDVILQIISNTNRIIAEQIRIAYPPKRAFRKIDRTPGKRIKRNQAKMMLPIIAAIGGFELLKVQSQPIPKSPFPSGKAPGGEAIVGPGNHSWLVPKKAIGNWGFKKNL